MRVTKAVLEARVQELETEVARLQELVSVAEEFSETQAQLAVEQEEVRKLRAYITMADNYGAEIVTALDDADQLFAEIQRNISVTGFFNPRNTAKMPREIQRRVKLLRRDIYNLVGPEESDAE